jgi:predicted double-glycine peptidase
MKDLPGLGASSVVAHLNVGQYDHYVVVLARDNKGVFFFDPAEGKTLYTSRAAFAAIWSGYILNVHTQENPSPAGRF